jgi:hypothetical protein
MRHALVIAALTWSLVACGSSDSTSTSTPALVGTDADAGTRLLTFDLDIAPPLRRSCAGTTCHSLGAEAAGLVLDGSPDDVRARLVSRPSTQSDLALVQPRNVERSFLVKKLRGRFDGATCGGSCGSKMPLVGTLDPKVEAMIEEWIENGAGL